MSLFVSGLTYVAQAYSGVVQSAPFTMSCFFYIPANSPNGRLLSLGSTNTVDDRAYLYLSNTNTMGYQIFQDGGSTADVTSSSTAPLNQWTHVAAVEASTTFRQFFISGNIAATNTQSRTLNSFDRTIIGAMYITGLISRPITGYIAEAAIWNRALTTGEIQSLSQGISPQFIRPSDLVFYTPLIGQTTDIKGLPLISSGNIPVNIHPAVFGR